jgi:cystathionine beta-lyase/cystathionine gamma-synthase
VDPAAEAIEKAIKPNTNIIFTESPANLYLRCLDITPSLGGSESLVTQMWMMSFFDYPADYRKKIGMSDNLVRLALGLEDVDDLIADLKQALEKI